MFESRIDAGVRLAGRLMQYRDSDALILSLPRGGVVVGSEISRILSLPHDIVAVRKVGHPLSPEYAICAVDDKGKLLCNEAEIASVNRKWLAEEVRRQELEAKRRAAVYRGGKSPPDVKGKKVILVDDGIATGLTIRLAILSLRKENPERIVVAVPVAPPDVAQELRKEADGMIVLMPPREYLGAVGAHYEEFGQVEDEEVISLLRQGYT